MGANMLTPLAHYGELWRTQRRLWHQHFGLKQMGRYNARVEMEARTLSIRLLENDRNVCSRLKLFVSSRQYLVLLINQFCLDGV